MTQRSSYPNPEVRPDWLGLVVEEVIDPDIEVIDPHHHFFDANGQHASTPYLTQELADDLRSGHNVVSTVYVQGGWRLGKDGAPAFRPVAETRAAAAIGQEWAVRKTSPANVCAGIVSYADLRLPELDAVLDAHMEAGGGRFRGVRQSAALDPAIVPLTTVPAPAGLMKQPDFQSGLRLLGQRGLTFDAFQYHPQLSDLLLAALAAPGTTIVIDHLGGPLRCGPYRTGDRTAYADWLSGMKALARCPNVYVKLGGLGMVVNGFNYHDGERPPTSQQLASDWKPWMDACIEAFGADRCMFESNFPVDKGMFSYTVVWNAFKKISANASVAERKSLMHCTAARVYGLA